jgi:hypothetical protein
VEPPGFATPGGDDDGGGDGWSTDTKIRLVVGALLAVAAGLAALAFGFWRATRPVRPEVASDGATGEAIDDGAPTGPVGAGIAAGAAAARGPSRGEGGEGAVVAAAVGAEADLAAAPSARGPADPVDLAAREGVGPEPSGADALHVLLAETEAVAAADPGAAPAPGPVPVEARPAGDEPVEARPAGEEPVAGAPPAGGVVGPVPPEGSVLFDAGAFEEPAPSEAPPDAALFGTAEDEVPVPPETPPGEALFDVEALEEAEQERSEEPGTQGWWSGPRAAERSDRNDAEGVPRQSSGVRILGPVEPTAPEAGDEPET